jgi:hypothetical protein
MQGGTVENWSRVIDGGKRGTDVRGVQPADDARLARAAAEELFLMGMPRVNVLLAGRDEVVRLVLRTLLGHVRKPIVSWCPGQRLALPPMELTGTLVLHEVGALGVLEQIQLLEWSGGSRRNPQVISTTSAPLLPRVRSGLFIDTLYYRLNTVYMDVTGLDEADFDG